MRDSVGNQLNCRYRLNHDRTRGWSVEQAVGLPRPEPLLTDRAEQEGLSKMFDERRTAKIEIYRCAGAVTVTVTSFSAVNSPSLARARST